VTSGIFAQAASGTAAAEPRQRARVRRVDALPPAGLPLRWSHVRLKHVAKLRSGESITSEQIGSSDEYPVFGGNGLRGYTAAYTHEGDFPLIGRQGALCGCVNFASGRFWASEHAVVAAPLNGHHSTWLFYVLSSMNLGQYSQSAAQPGLSVDVISNLVVPVPPTEQQRAIADFLDRETEKTDALVAKKQRLIELLQEKRTALISHAVSKGLDPDVPRNDSGIEWLAELPVGWQGLSLKRCVATPITDGPHETPEFADDGVPFLSADAVQGGILDFVRKRGCINRDLHEQYSRKCRPRRGDILLCKSGATTGKLALVQTDIAFSVWSPLALIRADENVVRIEFLVIALESEYVQNQIRRTWSEGTQANLSMAALGRLFVAVPPVEVQDRIVGMIRDQTATSTPVVDRIEDCLDKLLEYRSALITAAVTGQIDVRTYRREAS